VRTGRRGREREIKEIGVERDERKRIQGVINYSITNGKKNVSGAEGREKMKERTRKKTENIFITPIMKSLHILTSCYFNTLSHVCSFVCLGFNNIFFLPQQRFLL
jgi:hypothetical protein